MNKRAILKFIIVLITTISTFYFMNENAKMGDLSVVLVSLFLASTLFMYINRNKIKRWNFVYDVILMLLMFFSFLFIGYMLYGIVSCTLSPNCGMESAPLYSLLLLNLLMIVLLFSFQDIFQNTNKVSDILTIISSLVLLLIHLRYYLEPNFIHQIISNDYYQTISYQYITQNYGYFSFLYLISLLHTWVNHQMKHKKE